MKITIYKFIYDTDEATGCDISLSYEKALDSLDSSARSRGYDGPCDADAIA